MIFLSSLVVILLSIIAALIWNYSFKTESQNPYSHYFPANYFDGRENFESLASKSGFDLSLTYALDTVPFVADSNKNESLTTSVALHRGIDSKFLLHISGTHGPESYAGSAIQSSLLDLFLHLNLTDEDRALLPTIVFVHALNPYGFRTHRRVNEDNIDINRNFLTEEQFEFVKARDPNYARHLDFDAEMNPTALPFRIMFLNDVYM
eukprot:gene39268-53088_t